MDKTILNRPSFIYWICAIFLIIALAPVLCYQYFPTVDGPAHLYNAKIIRELWWGDSVLYSQVFKFNAELVPNWTGHFIAVLAGVIFPAWMVEKIMILLIVIGLMTGVHLLSRSFGATPSWRLLLLLPLIYTITLYAGFFNFMFSLVLMLYVLSWLVNWHQHQSKRYFVKVFLFTTLMYFSHVLAFGVAVIFTAMFFIWERLTNHDAVLLSRLNLSKALCFLPGVIFAIVFFSTRNMEGFRNKTEQIPFENLLQMVIEGRPMVGLNGVEEVPYTTFYMIGIALLMIMIFIIRFKNRMAFIKADLLLVFAIIMLICYFIVPDGMASGGFISVRLLLISLMFVLAWLLTFKLPVWVSVFAGFLGVYTSFSTLPYRMKATSQLDSDARNIVQLSGLVKQGSLVLPFNYADNWLHLNFPCYMGANGDFVLIDNYEANLNEFPLQWNDGFEPGPMFRDFKKNRITGIPIENYETASNAKIDCVARWLFDQGTTDSTSIAFDKYLRSHYPTIRKIGDGEILN